MVNDSLMANVFRHNAQRRPDVLLKYYIDFFLYPANRIIHNVLWQRKLPKRVVRQPAQCTRLAALRLLATNNRHIFLYPLYRAIELRYLYRRKVAAGSLPLLTPDHLSQRTK